MAVGLSQKQLGMLAGIDQFSASPRVNQYETGKHMPDNTMVGAICKVLDVPVAFMFCEDDQLASVLVAYSRLSDVGKQDFLHVSESCLMNYTVKDS